ncbi:FHA domain-containing protein [Streptomyces roseicoloratus]|uniref:FHA domain-containing protein n=1 Tax=Streptomyces roseicoloratus TaxID=2508722 RepID=A0ABY9RZD8_9ACTN|nr:FHA domain-containing protein [Streptomyces roseicoloratus]WMX47053.1 FHA domain-containing protein [Streptomyces roseicoloratus]
MAPFCEECRWNFLTNTATSYTPIAPPNAARPPAAPQGPGPEGPGPHGPGPQGPGPQGPGPQDPGYQGPGPQGSAPQGPPPGLNLPAGFQAPPRPAQPQPQHPDAFDYQGSRPSQVNRPAEPLGADPTHHQAPPQRPPMAEPPQAPQAAPARRRSRPRRRSLPRRSRARTTTGCSPALADPAPGPARAARTRSGARARTAGPAAGAGRRPVPGPGPGPRAGSRAPGSAAAVHAAAAAAAAPAGRLDRGDRSRPRVLHGDDAPQRPGGLGAQPARVLPEQHVPLQGNQVSIGRRRHSTGESPDIDLSVPPEDPGVSHQHAVLVAQPDGSWAVVDQNSTNGTTINGSPDPIQPYVPVQLQDGDRVHVGAWTTITVRRG